MSSSISSSKPTLTTPTPATATTRRRGAARVPRWGPLAWGTLVFLALVLVYRYHVAPRPIAGPLVSCITGDGVHEYLRDRPFMELASIRLADVVVAGDSRVMCGVAPPAFDEMLGLRESNLTAPLGYGGVLPRLLHTLERMPRREHGKLVVALSPLGIYNKQVPEPKVKESEWIVCRRLFDQSLDTAAQRVASRMVRIGVVNPNVSFEEAFGTVFFSPFGHWVASYPSRVDVEAITNVTDMQLGGTVEAREYNLGVVTKQMKKLREKGWDIVCIRMPISAPLRAVEEKYGAGHVFSRWCERNDLPFLDYSAEPYKTYDGSHLPADEAMRFTKRLATDLRERAGW